MSTLALFVYEHNLPQDFSNLRKDCSGQTGATHRIVLALNASYTYFDINDLIKIHDELVV